MRQRSDPWKWPFALGTAALLTCVLFLLVPAAWLDALFPDGAGRHPRQAAPAPRFLTLLPPPDIQLTVDEPPEPEPETPERDLPHQDPRWWDAAWQVQTVTARQRDLAPANLDSVEVLLSALGVGADFLNLARPDSVLANRLALLQLEDSFRFEELKPYLGAMTRARAYADILSRAADMYDDHLQSQIMVPD